MKNENPNSFIIRAPHNSCVNSDIEGRIADVLVKAVKRVLK